MGNVIVGSIIVIVLGLAIYKIYRDKKNNTSPCCGGCAGCKHAKQDESGNSNCNH